MRHAANDPSSENIKTPCSPFLITSVRGPKPRIARAALTMFHSPDSSRASASLIRSRSELEEKPENTTEWMAPSFEIVDCHFADWKFHSADSAAGAGGVAVGIAPSSGGHPAGRAGSGGGVARGGVHAA